MTPAEQAAYDKGRADERAKWQAFIETDAKVERNLIRAVYELMDKLELLRASLAEKQ